MHNCCIFIITRTHIKTGGYIKKVPIACVSAKFLWSAQQVSHV